MSVRKKSYFGGTEQRYDILIGCLWSWLIDWVPHISNSCSRKRKREQSASSFLLIYNNNNKETMTGEERVLQMSRVSQEYRRRDRWVTARQEIARITAPSSYHTVYCSDLPKTTGLIETRPLTDVLDVYLSPILSSFWIYLCGGVSAMPWLPACPAHTHHLFASHAICTWLVLAMSQQKVGEPRDRRVGWKLRPHTCNERLQRCWCCDGPVRGRDVKLQ